MNKSTVTLVLGAPAGGKTSLREDLIQNSPQTQVLNRDTEGGTIADLLPKLETYLSQGKDVVLDNLFPTVESRKPFLELAKKYNAEVNCKWLDTSIEDAQINFVKRAFDILGEFPSPEAIKKSKHPNIFPPTVFFKYRKEFEKPTKEEGFTSIEVVKFKRKYDPAFTNKGLVLDFDATLRECIGGNGKYPISPDQIKIMPKRKEIIESYQNKGYILLGLSNQSGVAKKELTLEQCDNLFKHTLELLGVDIEYHFCPHQSAPISCYCRKPQTGKAVEMILKHKLSVKDTVFVGDFKTDETMAKRIGFQYVDQAEFFK